MLLFFSVATMGILMCRLGRSNPTCRLRLSTSCRARPIDKCLAKNEKKNRLEKKSQFWYQCILWLQSWKVKPSRNVLCFTKNPFCHSRHFKSGIGSWQSRHCGSPFTLARLLLWYTKSPNQQRTMRVSCPTLFDKTERCFFKFEISWLND